MNPFTHVVISTTLAGLVWLALKSVPAALACLAAGVLIDLDHILDYLWNYGWRPRPRHFMRVFKHDILENIFVLLHSWELVPLGLLAVWYTGWHPVGIGILIGAVFHLALDQIFNKHSWPAYLLSYRIYHRFSARRFYGRREYRERLKKQRD